MITAFGLALAALGGEQVLFTIFVMFVAAKLAAEIFERLKQPAVAGEILAGVIIGPSVLGWVTPSELTGALSEIGVIFLLFLVGLETKPADIFRVGARAMLIAVLGVVLPFIAGYLIMLAWGKTQIEAIFVGAALVATSVGISARVLGQMGLLGLEVSRIILGAAVIDDILGLLILAVVSSLAKEGGVNYVQIGTTAALAVGFTLLVILVGARAGRKIEGRAIVSGLRLIALPRAGAGCVLHRRRGDHRRLPRGDGVVRIGRRHGHAASGRGRHRIPAAVLFDQHRDATQTGRAPEPQYDHPGFGGDDSRCRVQADRLRPGRLAVGQKEGGPDRNGDGSAWRGRYRRRADRVELERGRRRHLRRRAVYGRRDDAHRAAVPRKVVPRRNAS